MLYYDRIDVSEGIDFGKTRESKEWHICRYWHFLDKKFKFKPDVCNECHDVLMMLMNLSNITIPNIHVADYRCFIFRISKSEVINLMQKVNLSEKNGTI